MSARGRGNVTIKRGALPNLALAGKREGGATPSSNTRGGKRDGRGRGRGRGRGGGRGGFPKQALIQSEGIFSDGLSGADPSKRTADKDPAITFTISNRREKKEGATEKTYEDPGNGWEEMWESDEEEDKKELVDLLQDKFISDYRRGNKMPIVLPQQDEPQFFNVLEKGTKEEMMSDKELDDMEVDDIKPSTVEADSKEEDRNATIRFSKKAGHIFLQKDAEDCIFLLQLPSVVNVLSETSKTEEICISQPDGVIEDNERSKIVPKLPAGCKIGSLKVTRTGRLILHINGMKIDLSKSTNGGHQEGVMLLETMSRTEGSGGGILQVRSTEEGSDAVYFMGNVKHHLCGSLNWANVQPKTSTQSSRASPTKNQSKSNSSGNVDLKEKLASIRKETSNWSNLAERWAAPPGELPHSSGRRSGK